MEVPTYCHHSHVHRIQNSDLFWFQRWLEIVLGWVPYGSEIILVPNALFVSAMYKMPPYPKFQYFKTHKLDLLDRISYWEQCEKSLLEPVPVFG